jgi:hypothetical protein
MSADPTFTVQAFLLGLAFGLLGAHIGWSIGEVFERRARRRGIRETNERRARFNDQLRALGRSEGYFRMLDEDGDGYSYTEKEADAGR